MSFHDVSISVLTSSHTTPEIDIGVTKTKFTSTAKARGGGDGSVGKCVCVCGGGSDVAELLRKANEIAENVQKLFKNPKTTSSAATEQRTVAKYRQKDSATERSILVRREWVLEGEWVRTRRAKAGGVRKMFFTPSKFFISKWFQREELNRTNMFEGNLQDDKLKGKKKRKCSTTQTARKSTTAEKFDPQSKVTTEISPNSSLSRSSY